MPRRRLLALGISLALLIVIDQAVLHLALDDGYLLGRRLAPYDPPLFNSSHERAFARLESCLSTGQPPVESFRLDPELGWCPPRGGRVGDDAYDEAGARVGVAPIERARRAGVRRVVAVGCSFTEGAEVTASEAWPAQLDAAGERLEVANLGVGAYGLDQALLRWRRDGRPLAADEVWLGFLPTAAPRLVTLYRPAQRHWGLLVAFKPRFRLRADGELELVPCPAGDVRAVRDLIADSARFLAATGEHDAWVAACPAAYAPVGSRALHASSLGRLALTLLERRGRDVHARLADPADELHRLVRAVVLAARAEALAEGARFRLLVLPGREDLRAAAAAEGAPWAGLAAALEREGVEVIDLAPALLAAGGAGESSLWAPGGHYSARANALVAGELARLTAR